MFRLRQQHRLNRILMLAIALLISNVAALSCAMAVALCTDCPEHPPIVCAEPCIESSALIADTSPDESSGTFRPILVLPVLTTIDEARTSANSLIARHDPFRDVPVLPLRLRYCVYLK
jgi:hypothetical protein